MISKLSQMIKQTFGLWRARASGASYTSNTDGFCSVNTNVTFRVVPGDSPVRVPCLMPYGYISVPENNVNVVGSGLTGTHQSPVCLGIFPAFSEQDFRSNDLSAGESAVYSLNYSLRVSNSSCTFRHEATNGGTQYISEIQIGQWAKKIQTDIIEQLVTLFDGFLSELTTTFNTHEHDVMASRTGPPDNVSLPSTSISSALQEDLEVLNADGIYVKDGNAPP